MTMLIIITGITISITISNNKDSGKNIPENDDDRNNNRQAHLQYAICMHSFFQWKCKYELKKIKQCV